MQLINKQNDLSVTVFHFFQNRLQTFLKLSPVFCARHKSSHIKGEDRLVFQTFRHITAYDSLCKSLYNSGFSDTWFTDQNRVVFRLTGKDADHIPDLLITSDHRIQLLIPRPFHQILSVFVQRIIGSFRIVTCNSLVASYS